MSHPAFTLGRILFVSVLAGSGALLPAAFEITGELPVSFGRESVVLERVSLEERSSTPVASGRLAGRRFRLRVDAEPGLYSLTVGEAQVSLVAGAGQHLRVAPSADSRSLQVTGSPDHALFAAYEAFRSESLGRLVLPVRDAIVRAQATGNEREVERLTEAEVTGYREHRRELNDFTLAKLRGSPALYAASLRWDGDHRVDELAAVVREFAAANPGVEIARLMEERVAQFRGTAVGQLAPPLAGAAPDGSRITLDELRGRYVLVDFWASWCPPCRSENRHYAELYRRHRADGFEILAVSVDQDGNAWRAAIAKDGATWRHISDLSGWKTPLAARYNVTALPASFLLDREGRIVAKDLRGADLAALLATLLKAE
jgi:thiol-disulfide isomerase/thioredoxin